MIDKVSPPGREASAVPPPYVLPSPPMGRGKAPRKNDIASRRNRPGARIWRFTRMVLPWVLLIGLGLLLHRTGFGRLVFVIGNNAEVARYSGVRVARVKAVLFMMSGFVAALAGLLYAFRLGAVPRFDVQFSVPDEVMGEGMWIAVTAYGEAGKALTTVRQLVARALDVM